MKLFRAPQSSVVHIKDVLRSSQPLVWPGEIFQRFIDTVVCKCCLSQSFRQQWTPCANIYSKPVSLLEYLDSILSNHAVGCCNINFSFLSQIRREKFCFSSKDSIFLLYYFARLQLFRYRCHVWSTCPASCNPLIFFNFKPHSLCSQLVEKRVFSECAWVII